MKTRILTFALAIATLFVFAPVSSIANAVPIKVEKKLAVNPLSFPVSGVNGTTTFEGVYTITSFVVQNRQLYAVGTLTGTLTGIIDGVLTTIPVDQVVSVLATPTSGSCKILELHIGAIHLDLLGLVVDLAPVDLNITAQQGPGNLLGNLLCAVANLLNPGNGGTALNQLVNLLNQIVGILG
jgi:hypothetical protein